MSVGPFPSLLLPTNCTVHLGAHVFRWWTFPGLYFLTVDGCATRDFINQLCNTLLSPHKWRSKNNILSANILRWKKTFKQRDFHVTMQRFSCTVYIMALYLETFCYSLTQCDWQWPSKCCPDNMGILIRPSGRDKYFVFYLLPTEWDNLTRVQKSVMG